MVADSSRRATKKRKTESTSNPFVAKAYEVLTKEQDEFDAIGTVFASKLRRINQISELQRYMCENLMNQVLLLGLQNKVTETTTISNYSYPSFNQSSVASPSNQSHSTENSTSTVLNSAASTSSSSSLQSYVNTFLHDDKI